MKTIFKKPAAVERRWFLIDAEGKSLGRVAAKAAAIARGKEKPYFAPHQEMGDFVVVINSAKIKVTGRKAEDKLYHHHTGYPGGLKTETYGKLSARKPEAPLELAVKGMLPKGPLGRKLFNSVKVYAGGEHPHQAQNPQAVNL
ncbi:MAG: 50S ribosomal protein L13 [Spirochaetaceae bacterium]|jgi:large subunit ribosomal protein L13|nr:50S ribosomal protein L13 [Spirochaetaceae bacterium]